MKNKFIYIVLFLLGITVIFTIIFTIRFSVERKYSTNSESEDISVIDNQNKTLLVGIENNNKKEVKNEEVKEEEKKDEVVLDAATLTQQIYDMNSEIGTLYIPRTGLTTSIYSNSSVLKWKKCLVFYIQLED